MTVGVNLCVSEMTKFRDDRNVTVVGRVCVCVSMSMRVWRVCVRVQVWRACMCKCVCASVACVRMWRVCVCNCACACASVACVRVRVWRVRVCVHMCTCVRVCPCAPVFQMHPQGQSQTRLRPSLPHEEFRISPVINARFSASFQRSVSRVSSLSNGSIS